MLRASTPTKLSLARWAQLMGIHPLHFAGIRIDDGVAHVACGEPWRQYAWQQPDRTSREDVAEAINAAESELEEWLGFRLMPTWERDEWVNSRTPGDPSALMFPGGDIRGFGFAREARWKLWIAPGIRGSSLIAAGAAITWSDADADGYKETGTVSVATAVDACEVQAFYPGMGPTATWQIRPAKVTTAGGTATITFRRELVPKAGFSEYVLEPTHPYADGLADGDFLATVDVWRIYNDPRTQGSFLWEPTGDCGCNANGCPNCAYATQDGCFIARNARLSLVVGTPATWNADTNAFDAARWGLGRGPDITRLYYLAGAINNEATCPRTSMPTRWEQIVAELAASKLSRAPCECSAGRWDYLTQDLAFASGDDDISTYRTSAADLASPFGTRRGAVQAWRWVSKMDIRVGRSGAVTV